MNTIFPPKRRYDLIKNYKLLCKEKHCKSYWVSLKVFHLSGMPSFFDIKSALYSLLCCFPLETRSCVVSSLSEDLKRGIKQFHYKVFILRAYLPLSQKTRVDLEENSI